MTNKLKKGAMFSDIHWGKKAGSDEHNNDCMNFIDWFCEQVKNDPTIDHIHFLGDWHDHRAAISVNTLMRSYEGAEKLNKLGLPIFFASGNHDLYRRNSSDIFSTYHFSALENFKVMNKVTVLNEIHGKVLFIPFIQEHEYPELLKYSDIPVAMGHLELQGFRITGSGSRLEHGPKSEHIFKHQKRVFSGHLHMRETKGNTTYIGSPFPMDFSDVNDTERGMAVYDFVNDNLEFIDWPDAPRYRKASLTDLLKDPKKILSNNARVRIEVDEEITLEEANELRASLQEKYKLREITLEDSLKIEDIELTDIEEEIEELKLESTGEVIRELIKRIKVDKIDTDLLLKIYDNLSVASNDIVAKASNIQFMELTLRNYLSYGNATTTINLDFSDPTLIIGRNYDSVVDGQIDSNGSGKSSILNSMLLCLYDDNLMGVKKDAQINNSNGKDMMITCTFKINDTYYKVERYRKNKAAGGDGVRIYVNEKKPVFDESHDKTPDSVDNANKFIAGKLGIPYEMFIRIVVFSATHKPFLSLPSSHASQANQRDIIEELFGLTEISSKAEMLKETLKNDKKDFINLQSTNEMIMAEYDRHMEQIVQNENRIKTWDTEHSSKVETITTQLQELEGIYLQDTIDSFEQIKIQQEAYQKVERNLPALEAELRNVQSLGTRQEKWEAEHKKTLESLNGELSRLESYDFNELRKKRDELSELQEEYRVLSNNVNGTVRERNDTITTIKTLENSIKSQEQEIEHLGNQECPYCHQKYDEAKSKLHECEEKLSTIRKELTDAREELDQFNETIDEAKDILDEIQKGIDVIKGLNIPPNLDVLEQSKITLVDRIAEEQSKKNPHVVDSDDLTEEELTEAILEIRTELESIQTKIDMANEFIHPNFTSESDIDKHINTISNLKIRLNELKEEKNPFVSVHQSLTEQKLAEPKNDEINALDKRIKHQDFLIKLLTKKDSFIRKALLNKSIPLLNTRLRMYLDKIGLPHKVKFNEEMGVDISQFGSDYEYGQFSSGQKARVNICLAFAFRDVLQSRFGKINLCILDECLDTGLGAVGVGLVAKMIKEIAIEHDLSMFVISHREEVSTMFDKRLEIELRNGFSTIKDEDDES